MAEDPQCLAVTAPGLELITASELEQLGIAIEGTVTGGVAFGADLPTLYRANLQLRSASRVIVRTGVFTARTWFELERHAGKLPWGSFLGDAVPEFEVTSRKSRLYHERGIAERLQRIVAATRPVPDGAPTQRFIVRVHRDQFTISADASGELLHRRGYRQETAKAPLRETLAAAMLLGCGWRAEVPLLDPFCGSGTIPIEAALIAGQVAPGLHRRFAFEKWPGHDAHAWDQLLQEARARMRAASVEILASDRDAGAIEAARANAERAGVAADIALRVAPLSAMASRADRGLLLTNPPYGARIGEEKALRNLYAQLGNVVRDRLPAWRLALLGANPRLEGQLALPLTEIWRSSNGGIPVRLLAS